MSSDFLPWVQALIARVGWRVDPSFDANTYVIAAYAPPEFSVFIESTDAEDVPWRIPIISFKHALMFLEKPTFLRIERTLSLWMHAKNSEIPFGAYHLKLHGDDWHLVASVSFLADSVTERHFGIALVTLQKMEEAHRAFLHHMANI